MKSVLTALSELSSLLMLMLMLCASSLPVYQSNKAGANRMRRRRRRRRRRTRRSNMRMMMMTMIRRSGKRSSLRRRRRRRRRRSNTHTRLGALQEVEVLRDGFGVGDEVVRGVARERGARGGVVARPAQLGPARDVIAQVPVLHVVDHRLRAAPQPVPAGHRALVGHNLGAGAVRHRSGTGLSGGRQSVGPRRRDGRWGSESAGRARSARCRHSHRHFPSYGLVRLARGCLLPWMVQARYEYRTEPVYRK